MNVIEVNDPKGFRRVRMRRISDASGASFIPFPCNAGARYSPTVGISRARDLYLSPLVASCIGCTGIIQRNRLWPTISIETLQATPAKWIPPINNYLSLTLACSSWSTFLGACLLFSSPHISLIVYTFSQLSYNYPLDLS